MRNYLCFFVILYCNLFAQNTITFPEFLNHIHQKTGLKISYSSSLRKTNVASQWKKTITRENWQQSLPFFAKEHNLIIEQKGKSRLVITNRPKVIMQFYSADIRDVLLELANLGNISIIIAPTVSGSLNLRLQNVTWREAIATIVKHKGYRLIIENSVLYIQ